MYYNTTKESMYLKEYIEKAENQNEIVEKIFKIYQKELSPSQVLKLSKLDCPLTSIRRSMTNLTKQDKLVKTENKITGDYGRPEYLWKLK